MRCFPLEAGLCIEERGLTFVVKFIEIQGEVSGGAFHFHLKGKKVNNLVLVNLFN